MIHFFGKPQQTVYAVQSSASLSTENIDRLSWLFGNQKKIALASIDAFFVGPRATMVSPWSTNAVEIAQNMGVSNIIRIEAYNAVQKNFSDYDAMLLQKFDQLNQQLFDVDILPQPLKYIKNIADYNQQEGLALSSQEIDYLNQLAKRLKRKLTDTEVYGFAQINSEHCRHKIFNGKFIIDGKEKPESLFQLIKKTAAKNPNTIVSAYTDNVAFIKGPHIVQFAPKSAHKPDFYIEKKIATVISLKAETHNFPTTVEAFYGAATGSGGEIRDRLAGGKGSIPLAGTAVYMTSYPRLEKNRPWEQATQARNWLYQSPVEQLIKASNGASDYGNKFGQPLIAGSILTFEHQENSAKLGFDKVIMLAGGIGYGKIDQSLKDTPKKDDEIVVMGGDNYRIGMGGAAVSSADTGQFTPALELNAVQRANPEMQKRVANAIRAMIESDQNPIVSIHDHGAGGHLNCLSELVETTGGKIEIDQLPLGDNTLSLKEIIGNESQERMGLIISKKNLDRLKQIAARERAPLYQVGKVTDNQKLIFQSKEKNQKPMNLGLVDLFGNSPKTVTKDVTVSYDYGQNPHRSDNFYRYLEQVLQLESVACKDWLTNKIDRCVGGLVAKQQCAGVLQLPLNNCGVMALDFKSKEGIATAIGHAPISALIDPKAGSQNAIAKALTNIIWAPLKEGLKSVSLSANWMWPCNNKGEDARLYQAVKACSDFAIALGINIPTGKDSLSMTQKYSDDQVVAPGTVVISAAANCSDITKVVEPVFQKNDYPIYYLNLSQDNYKTGGSAFAQINNSIGKDTPSIKNTTFFIKVFSLLQKLIKEDKIIAGHDISSGGLITTLLEMCFADINLGATIMLSELSEKDSIKLLFSENVGVVFQANPTIETTFKEHNIPLFKIGTVVEKAELNIINNQQSYSLGVSKWRDIWYKTSMLLDEKQTAGGLAKVRFENYKKQPLHYRFPKQFTGKKPTLNKYRPKAAVLREKGSNSEREMANAMYLAGFDVKDIHMTDLINGKESLADIQFLGAVGGFSNSDVLGAAKGWAGAVKYNQKAQKAIQDFFNRKDTLSVGICNGCQLFMELEMINPNHATHGKVTHNDSGKHESAFTSVIVQKNNSVMLSSLEGARLGIWISHGEGKFKLPLSENQYQIVAKYGYDAYPSNPNGSDYNTAMLCDKTGRHLVSMPHIERSTFPWNWANYPADRKDDVSPWLSAFVNARKWIEQPKCCIC